MKNHAITPKWGPTRSRGNRDSLFIIDSKPDDLMSRYLELNIRLCELLPRPWNTAPTIQATTGNVAILVKLEPGAVEPVSLSHCSVIDTYESFGFPSTGMGMSQQQRKPASFRVLLFHSGLRSLQNDTARNLR